MRSILFKPEMYDATVVKLIKSETRRTHGLQKVNEWPLRYFVASSRRTENKFLEVKFEDAYRSNPDESNAITIRSKYKIGEIVYIAEPMWVAKEYDKSLTPLEIPHQYHYDLSFGGINAEIFKKVSPMFMRQEYGRRFIQITDIFIERLQEITRAGIIREGVVENHTVTSDHLLRIQYATLFDKINGAGSWDKNLYVFGYRFDYLPNYKRRLNA